MEQVFTRVAKWNAARYEQEYNQELTLKLLNEEYQEWKEAKTLPEKIQELCDVIFVAYGAMWKLGEEIDNDIANQCFMRIDVLSDTYVNPGVIAKADIDSLEIAGEADKQSMLAVLFSIALAAQAQILSYGLNFGELTECLLVLCDSNDSKKVVKTASDTKANDNDKGSYYRSPIPGITQIVEQMTHAKH